MSGRTEKIKKAAALLLTGVFLWTFCVSSYGEDVPCYFNDEEKHIYACARMPCKRVALTFDDGPHPVYTDRILRVLDKYGAKATFFVVGENVGLYPEVFRRVLSKGHAVGSHTYTHGHIRKQSEKTLRAELMKTREILSSFGVTTRLFRPPEGVCDEKVLKLARENACEIILWAVDTGDWRCPPANGIVKEALGHVKGGEIVLMHDYVAGKSSTPEALDRILAALSAEGYEFVTVTELLEIG